jgi:hypothetical protein
VIHDCVVRRATRHPGRNPALQKLDGLAFIEHAGVAQPVVLIDAEAAQREGQVGLGNRHSTQPTTAAPSGQAHRNRGYVPIRLGRHAPFDSRPRLVEDRLNVDLALT